MSNGIRLWLSDAASPYQHCNWNESKPVTSVGQDVMTPLCLLNMARSCLMTRIFFTLAFLLASLVMLPPFGSKLFYLLLWEIISYHCILINIS